MAEEVKQEIVPAPAPNTMQLTKAFGSEYEMNQSYRIAKLFAASDMVPDNFKGKPGECLIAIDMALRTNMPPLSVLQEIYMVHGKPSFSSKFLIATVNSCGRFTPLNYKKGEKGGIIAYAKSKESGEMLESPEVTIEMAQAEGWLSKPGSKWKTMPDLMLRYRAATFFARLYAPDVTNGIRTTDEWDDIEANEQVEKKKEFTVKQ